MTFSEGASSHETALGAAFSAAGLTGDSALLREAVNKCRSAKIPEAALWLMCTKDKALASAAMRAAMQFSRGQERIPKASAAPRAVHREVRREAKLQSQQRVIQAAQAMVARVEPKVIERHLDKYRLVDGTLLKDRHWYELNHIATANEKDARILRAVIAFVRPASDRMKVGHVISADDFDAIAKSAT